MVVEEVMGMAEVEEEDLEAMVEVVAMEVAMEVGVAVGVAVGVDVEALEEEGAKVQLEEWEE